MKKRMKRAERLDLSAQAFIALALAFLALAGVSLFSNITVWLVVGEEYGLRFWEDVFSGGQITLFICLAAAFGLTSLLFYRRSRRPARGIYYRPVQDARGIQHPSRARI